MVDLPRGEEVGHLGDELGDVFGVHGSTLSFRGRTLHSSVVIIHKTLEAAVAISLFEAVREHPEVDRVGEVVPAAAHGTDQLVDGAFTRGEEIHVVVGEEADRGALRGGEGLAVVEEGDDVLHGPSITFR